RRAARLRADRRRDRGRRPGAPHPPARLRREIGCAARRLDAAAAALPARLRRDVLGPYRPGRRGLRLRLPAGGREDSRAGDPLEHDPEKWPPVFGKDHAQTFQHELRQGPRRTAAMTSMLMKRVRGLQARYGDALLTSLTIQLLLMMFVV